MFTCGEQEGGGSSQAAYLTGHMTVETGQTATRAHRLHIKCHAHTRARCCYAAQLKQNIVQTGVTVEWTHGGAQ